MSDLLDLLDSDPQPEREHFARASDPDTSRTAAELGDSFGRLTQDVMAALVEVERTNPYRVGATAFEIRMRMAFDRTDVPDNGSVCRRLTSLHRKGYVVDVGERRRGGKNRDQIAWTSTESGREWSAS